jgi:hypothetical protein
LLVAIKLLRFSTIVYTKIEPVQTFSDSPSFFDPRIVDVKQQRPPATLFSADDSTYTLLIFCAVMLEGFSNNVYNLDSLWHIPNTIPYPSAQIS